MSTAKKTVECSTVLPLQILHTHGISARRSNFSAFVTRTFSWKVGTKKSISWRCLFEKPAGCRAGQTAECADFEQAQYDTFHERARTLLSQTQVHSNCSHRQQSYMPQFEFTVFTISISHQIVLFEYICLWLCSNFSPPPPHYKIRIFISFFSWNNHSVKSFEALGHESNGLLQWIHGRLLLNLF